MLIIPKQRSSDINNITEFSELDRRIIIYSSSINLDPNEKYSFSLMNISVQNGSVGALQSRSELLYTVNSYYGNIVFPFVYRPDLSREINFDADVRIKDYGFAHKMVNTFKDSENTNNHLMWMKGGNILRFSGVDSDSDQDCLAPSDPRFYNLDHQIIVTDDDAGFYTECGMELGHHIPSPEEGVLYKLRELIDNHTHIYVSKIHIEDPYKLIRNNDELMNFVNDILCQIQNVALLTLAKSYTIILDKELGYNILNLKRLFKNMDKKNEIFEISNFFETVKESYEKLMDSNFNIRLTIIYNDSQTNVSILPIIKKEEAIMKSKISDVVMYEYGVETLVNE